jgi:hypothetical protein
LKKRARERVEVSAIVCSQQLLEEDQTHERQLIRTKPHKGHSHRPKEEMWRKRQPVAPFLAINLDSSTSQTRCRARQDERRSCIARFDLELQEDTILGLIAEEERGEDVDGGIGKEEPRDEDGVKAYVVLSEG